MNARPYRLLAAACGLLWAAVLAGQSPEFSAGNEAFAEGRLTDALRHFQADHAAGPSAAVCHNLALTHQRLGQTGLAVALYEQALWLEPGHAGARHNLDRLRAEAGLAAPARTWPEQLASPLPPAAWAALGSAGLWGAAALLTFWRPRRDPWLRWAAGLLLAALGATCLAGGQLAAGLAAERIVAADTALRVSPLPDSPATSRARGGEAARLAGQRDAFVLLQLPDGRSGWVEAHLARPLYPAPLPPAPAHEVQ